jgi:EAL domain-containing protein (putative c-di-GMP-specific phosphodiesterase class I)
VEQQAQLARLGELGCDQVQGYLLARPLPAAAFTAELIHTGTARPTGRHLQAAPQRAR